MACLILRSCTTGNNTIIVTNAVQSPSLNNYVGYHVPITGYPNVCFSVELSNLDVCPCVLTQQTEVTIDKTQLAKSTLAQDLCNCTSPFTAYILTPCDPALPSLYTQQNLNPYVGQTITFFGQDGVCYTVNGSLTIPPGLNPVAVECISSCQCVIEGCGCPDGYTLNPETGICEGYIEVPPTGGTTLLTVINGLTNSAWGTYGAWFFDDVSSLPKPLTANPSPAPWTLVDDLGIPCIINNTVFNSLWKNRLIDVSVWASGFTPGVPQGKIGMSFCFEFPESKIYYFGISCDDLGTLSIDGNLIIDVAPYVTWTVLPIYVTAGQHVIGLTMEDTGSVAAGLGFEIYDAPSYAVLQACTTANGTPGPTDLNQYILISTLDKKTPPGQTWDTGQYNGFSCPDGYFYSPCGTPACVQLASAPKLPCFTFKITFCDGTGLEPIITNTDLTQYIGGIYNICYTEGEIEICGCGSVSQTDVEVAPDFTGTFSSVSYTCCEECIPVCYLLTNCQDEEDTLVTNSDLSNYINHVISITGCQDKCWIVTESEDCESCIGKVEIIKDCPPSQSEAGTLCSYDVGEIDSNQVLSYSITINGTVYSFTLNPGDKLEVILSNINGLNLGQFSVGLVGTDPVYYMAGSETYGTLCYTRCLNPPDCLLVQNICIDPVCTPQSTECAYAPISVQDARGYYKIVIDGVTYTSPVFNNLNNPGPLLVWLTGLNKGIFTITYTPLPGRQISVFAYGNHIYGTLSIFLEKDDIPLSSVNAECTPLGTSTPDCACCLPPPPPQPGELVLHPRRIKPGYFSKNSCITTDYMERVNCNFAKQVYDAMLIKRYGITVCCDHDVDSWDIKKQVLDFELLTDPELCKSTLCKCPEPCLVSVSIALVPQCLAPVIVDTSIVLQCSCFTAVGTDYTLNWTDCDGIINSADFLTNTVVCAQSVPVVVDGTATIAYVSTCGSPLCVAPPVPQCYCYTLSKFTAFVVINYINCEGEEVTQELSLQVDAVNICAQEDTLTVVEGSVAVIIKNGPCSEVLDCLACKCYIVKSFVEEVTPIQILTCNNETTTINLPSGQGAYLCSKTEIQLGRGYEVITFDSVNCPEGCEEQCQCLEIFANGDVEFTYLDCNNVIQEVSILSGNSQNICGKQNSIYVTSVGFATITVIGACPCPEPPPCVPGCYRLLAIEPAVIFYLDCETGQTLELPVTAGTWFICSGNVPTFTGGVTEVVFISNDCGLDCTPL